MYHLHPCLPSLLSHVLLFNFYYGLEMYVYLLISLFASQLVHALHEHRDFVLFRWISIGTL